MLQDPLSINIEGQGIDTTIPVLADGDKLLKVIESSIKTNKDGTGLNWELKLGLENGEISRDGREVKPGFPLFVRIACQPAKDSTDVEAFKRQIFAAVDALFGTTKDNRPAFNQTLVTSAVGRPAVGTVLVSEWPKGSGQYKNDVARLKPAPTGL